MFSLLGQNLCSLGKDPWKRISLGKDDFRIALPQVVGLSSSGEKTTLG